MKVRQLGMKGRIWGTRLASQKGQQKLLCLQHVPPQLRVEKVRRIYVQNLQPPAPKLTLNLDHYHNVRQPQQRHRRQKPRRRPDVYPLQGAEPRLARVRPPPHPAWARMKVQLPNLLSRRNQPGHNNVKLLLNNLPLVLPSYHPLNFCAVK